MKTCVMKPAAMKLIGNQFVNILKQTRIQVSGGQLNSHILRLKNKFKILFSSLLEYILSVAKTFILFLSFLILLSGCSTTSEVFECETGKGIGCKSISEVNKMVDQGQVGENIEDSQTLKTSAPVFAQNTMSSEKNPIDAQEIVLSDKTTVKRVKEDHLRVWIAPFQDEQGNLHEGSVIHTVIRPGYWQLTPVV
jgi:conjugal transfer pilus assembly protein TraV